MDVVLVVVAVAFVVVIVVCRCSCRCSRSCCFNSICLIHCPAAQDAAIATAKKRLNDITVPASDGAVQPVSDSNQKDSEPALVDMPIILQGPAKYALHLLQKASCNEEQTDVIALLTSPLQKRWDFKQQQDAVGNQGPPQALPNNWFKDNCSLLLLGGGGVGKSYILIKVIKPLYMAYFPGGPGILVQCQSNAAARLVGGRTLHSSLEMTPASSLSTHSLRPQGDQLARRQKIFDPLGGLVIDECGQAAAKLLHANALRVTCARRALLKLEVAQYMQRAQLFGCMPMVPSNTICARTRTCRLHS